MQEHMELLSDIRGCMTRFDQLTPEIVASESSDGITFEELKTVMKECGMAIEKVVYDATRRFQNAFYADFERGHYCWIPLQKANLKAILSTASRFSLDRITSPALQNRRWDIYYTMDVPLPMLIYDFERRYRDIEPERVFSVWSKIHTRIDYANGM